tara:strand:+ start:691 stop:1095 length:405 start_codon:yes stop_codon:yes gene_type:complete
LVGIWGGAGQDNFLKETGIEELVRQLREFAEARDWEQFHSPKNLSMALCVEAGELMEQFQWMTEEQSRSLDPSALKKLEEEIGDVMNYLTSLASFYGIDPLDAALKKIRLNASKYPVHLARGNARKYDELHKED